MEKTDLRDPREILPEITWDNIAPPTRSTAIFTERQRIRSGPAPAPAIW
jgi:hypothetical protein